MEDCAEEVEVKQAARENVPATVPPGTRREIGTGEETLGRIIAALEEKSATGFGEVTVRTLVYAGLGGRRRAKPDRHRIGQVRRLFMLLGPNALEIGWGRAACQWRSRRCGRRGGRSASSRW